MMVKLGNLGDRKKTSCSSVVIHGRLDLFIGGILEGIFSCRNLARATTATDVWIFFGENIDGTSWFLPSKMWLSGFFLADCLIDFDPHPQILDGISTFRLWPIGFLMVSTTVYRCIQYASIKVHQPTSGLSSGRHPIMW